MMEWQWTDGETFVTVMGSGRDVDVAAQPPINSARKMPSAEGALRKLARALVIERKKI